MSLIGNGEYKPINHTGRILTFFFGPWGIPLLVLIGWGPLLADQLLATTFGDAHYSFATFGMLYGLSITLISTLCVVLLLVGYCAHFLMRLGRRLFSRK